MTYYGNRSKERRCRKLGKGLLEELRISDVSEDEHESEEAEEDDIKYLGTCQRDLRSQFSSVGVLTQKQ